MRSARAALLLAAWLATASAGAQIASPTGNLYGNVVDVQANAVPDVTVTIDGPGAPQTASTDRNGDFHFLELSPASYSVRLERAGFETIRRSVSVGLGNVVQSFVLPPTGMAETETVTVTGDAPAGSRDFQTGATYGQKELESIPTTRDPWAILRQVPGVLVANVNVGNGRHPRQSPFVGQGSTPSQNVYNLDGAPISVGGVSPLYYDFDSFSGIEVATGGADPSLSSPGVSLNLVTKRGSGQLHGSARGLYTGGTGWDYGVESGGPLWKDRVWLWAAFARDSFLGQTVFAAGEPIDNQETLKHWNAKLNAELIAANSLTLSYTNFDRFTQGAGARPDVSLPATSTLNLHSEVIGVADSQVLSSKLFASFSLSYVNGGPTQLPLGGLDEQADFDEDGILRHSNSSWHLQDSQRGAALNASTFFDTGSLRHELKFGFGYRYTRLDSTSTWPGDQLVGYALDGQAAITRPLNVKSQMNAYDVFVGDTIQAANLTVSIGVRFDYEQGRNLASSVPANPVFPDLLPAVQYGGDSGYPVTWRQVQPRVGVAYALGADRKTLLRASYSRFADQLGNTVRTVNAFPSIASLYYGWTDANGNGRVEPGEMNLDDFRSAGGVDPYNPGASAQINRISPNLEPPTTDEFILGVERRIGSDVSASLTYTHRIVRNLEFAPLIGTTTADYRYLGNAAGTAVSASNGFVLDFSEPSFGLVECPPPCVGTQLQNRPDANQAYDGVALQLLKPFSNGWMARLGVGYDNWRQQIGPGAIVNPNNEPPGTNVSGPVVEGIINARWKFNVSGMAVLPFGIAAAGNFFGREGFPIVYSIFVVTPLDVYYNETLQVGPATRYRNPNVYDLDLQLSRDFRIGPVTVVPQLACFNVIGSRTVLQRDGSVGTYFTDTQSLDSDPDVFNAVAETLSARTFRGGVRITF